MKKGFTLIEAVIGIALVAIAVLGLAEMFTLSVMNNLRSDRITNASFLAQQQIDVLRNLTGQEIGNFYTSANGIDLNFPPDSILDIMKDEPIDINGDSKYDYRRLTQVQPLGTSWQIEVLVFSSEQMTTPQASLLGNPTNYRVRARMSTIISR
jgi:prepilin-type N-terminal cleavage/methylation domain-containing protein